jgi:hypothetical protein
LEPILPTFTELTKSLSDAKHRRAILLHLVEHIDSTFRPVAGEAPERFLLDDDKLPVPAETFDSVVQDTLLAEVQQLDQEIARITNFELTPAAPTQAEKPAVAGAQPQPPQQHSRRRHAEKA